MLVNKKEKAERKKRERSAFLRSRQFSYLVGICMIAVLVLAGILQWNKGSLVRRGLALCEMGDYAEAKTCFQNAVLNDNMNADNYMYLGLAYLGTDDLEDAERQFRLALNLDQDHEGALRGMGIIQYRRGEYEEAVASFNHALDTCGIRIGAQEYDILWYRADAEKALQDYEAAAYTYGALIELAGDTALTRYHRGNVYCLLGQKEAAMADFDEAVTQKGNDYDLFWNIYDSMAQAGWKEEAEGYLKLTREEGYISVQREEGSSEVQKYQGMIDYICGSYDTAITALSADDLKHDEQAQNYLALSYEMKGETDQALGIYLKHVNEGDPSAADYNRLARYYLRHKQGQQAVLYLNKGIERCADDDLHDLYFNLVSAYESYGAYGDALEALKKYIEVYGEDEQAKQEKAFLKNRKR